ncbi:MAG: DUF1097 domain-containing protein [Firmicutes bacterium HGW-Firmicutes-7]|nr:MAG: DUF1097 domain-containing protein [Firmicutes bacterium HGW-Firmicutes-7]
MDLILAIGIVVGILAGIWGEVSSATGMITWIGFVSWACFYASGGGLNGLKKTIPSNLVGVFWGYVIVFGASNLGIPYALGVSIFVACVAMCVESKWSILSFIPGAFAGCASFFGAGFDIKGTVIALVIGGVLGYFSEVGGVFLSKIRKKTEANS